MKELSKQFDFKACEDRWIKHWKDNDLFHAVPDSNKEPYVVMIPPPNVTGILHMGHALNNTLQDIIIRYKRMNGFAALWMPGTDHAGIATQNVVERALKKEGKTRDDLGREAFVEKLWDWKQQYGDTIINQLEKIGASCDWPRTAFTMDDGYSNAVKKVFIELFNKDLIYRGNRIINWCPRCQTALSDEEAEHKDTNGKLYHFKYPIKDSDDFVIVATTRPETMLGDTAVAVNPDDKRYKDLIGKKLVLPLVNREIEVIADSFVDPEFGTGCVKVTPAHDPNDFAMGERHNLEFINVMHPDGRINENGGDFSGQDRFEAREAVLDSLDDLKLVEKIEDHAHAVGHCYRCHTVVEPYLSKQWFVKMEPLAKPAAEAVTSGKLKIHPKRWEKVYLNWMDGIRDWCISRQIWWGHRIPIWYDEEGNTFAANNEEEALVQAKEKHGKVTTLTQDEDVLDTWFSSWLWPFATLNWPEESKDLKFFYPGSSLFTASEIIFFWVARMVMAGIEFMDDIPFKDVYIHGTVRDSKGLKMSKSLGNALDPLEIIEEYGADALRFSLIMNSGQDLYISKDKFEIGRNFANKVWNASRLVMMNVKTSDSDFNYDELDLPSKWILSRFHSTVEKLGESIEQFRYSEAESLVYEFFWNNFCDWYLEIIKKRWDEENIQKTALFILENSLKILSPFMPFVTEEIWSILKEGEDAICIQSWPEVDKTKINSKAEESIEFIIETVSALRNIRAEFQVGKKETFSVLCSTNSSKEQKILEEGQEIISQIESIESITFEQNDNETKNAASAVIGETKIIVPLGDLIDIEKEKKRIQAQIDDQQKAFSNLDKRLSNENFLNKAPLDVVEKEKARLAEMQSRINKLEQVISQFN